MSQTAQQTPSPPPVPVRPANRTAREPQSPAGIVTHDETLSPGQRLVRWLTGADAAGFATSTLLHVVVLSLLALWITKVDIPIDLFGSQLKMESSEKLGVLPELNNFQKLQLIEAGGVKNAQQVSTMPKSFFRARRAISGKLPSDLVDSIDKIAAEDKGTGSGKTTGAGKGETGKTALPSGGPTAKAVTKGSFTVWAFPPDPAVGQSYHIIIRVRLPEKATKYMVTDLTGSISGDLDGHRQSLPFDREWGNAKARFGRRYAVLDDKSRKFVPIIKRDGDRYVQIYVWVPGSAIAKTTDTIKVHSKLLNERQEIKIVF